MVGPKQETAPRSAPAEVVMPGVLNNESEILFISKVDCSLGILRLPNVDTDGRNAPLLARDVEGDI